MEGRIVFIGSPISHVQLRPAHRFCIQLPPTCSDDLPSSPLYLFLGFPCKFCHHVFEQKKRLNRHMRNQHPDMVKRQPDTPDPAASAEQQDTSIQTEGTSESCAQQQDMAESESPEIPTKVLEVHDEEDTRRVVQAHPDRPEDPDFVVLHEDSSELDEPEEEFRKASCLPHGYDPDHPGYDEVPTSLLVVVEQSSPESSYVPTRKDPLALETPWETKKRTIFVRPRQEGEPEKKRARTDKPAKEDGKKEAKAETGPPQDFGWRSPPKWKVCARPGYRSVYLPGRLPDPRSFDRRTHIPQLATTPSQTLTPDLATTPSQTIAPLVTTTTSQTVAPRLSSTTSQTELSQSTTASQTDTTDEEQAARTRGLLARSTATQTDSPPVADKPRRRRDAFNPRIFELSTEEDSESSSSEEDLTEEEEEKLLQDETLTDRD